MQPDHIGPAPRPFPRNGAQSWPAPHSSKRETDVGVFHIRAAYGVAAGGPGPKAVLVCMADRACDVCGMAWPGVAYLADRTEIPERRVSIHLRALLDSGLLTVHGYSKGGRGRSTEYIVLPQVAKLSTAPCEKCAQLGKTLSPRAGFTGGNPVVSGVRNPVATSTPSISIYPSVDPSANTPRKPAPSATGRSKASLPADTPESAAVPPETLDFLRSLGLKPPTGHPAAKEDPKP